MTTPTTDVRVWLREHGEEVPERGPIPKSMRALFDEAHAPAGPAGPEPDDAEPDEPADAGASYDGGVSAADFVSAEPPPAAAAAAAGAAPAGERRPRSVRRRQSGRASVGRVWARATGSDAGAKDTGKDTKKRKRVSLESFVEEAYGDLAWLAAGAGAVPLARMLQVQASYAGVIAEQQFKETVVDKFLQPVARAQGALAAFNGLVGPPVFVGAIMTQGQRVQYQRPVVDEHGQPVYLRDPATGDVVRDPETSAPVQATMIEEDFDTRTKMMFVGLRYTLLQMTKVTDKTAREIIEHGEQRMQRGREVDDMIAWIFNMPRPETAESRDEEEAIKRAHRLIGGP